MNSSSCPIQAEPTATAFDAVIFDLGGVIVSLFPGRTVNAFSELYGQDARPAYTQALQAEMFDRFERGEISREEFRAEVDDFFGALRHIPSEEFDNAWSAMLGEISEDTFSLLEYLGKTKRLFVLSNTNEIHIEKFLLDYRTRHQAQHGPFEGLFEKVHYSHDLRMRKPEERIFVELVRMHSLDPKRTLFIDDNRANIESAERVGLRSIHHATNAPLGEAFSGLLDTKKLNHE